MAAFDTGLEKGFKGMFSTKGKAPKLASDPSPPSTKEKPPPPYNKLSKLPKNHCGKRRYMFQNWPRDPARENDDLRGGPGLVGKQAPNGIERWGETIFNHYFFKRGWGFTTPVTSSMMARWCKEFNENEEFVKHDLEVAALEDEPRLIEPGDIAEVIKENDAVENKALVTLPILQQILPSYLLPEKLVIHDPDNVLSVDGESAPASKDGTRTYVLSLSPETRSSIETQRKEVLDAHEAKLKSYPATVLLVQDMIGRVRPASQVQLPPPLPPILSIPEAHMYVTRSACLGEGNHSFVYDVELELPRSLFFELEICPSCIFEDVESMIDAEEKIFFEPLEEKIVAQETVGEQHRAVYDISEEQWNTMTAIRDIEGYGQHIVLEPTPIDYLVPAHIFRSSYLSGQDSSGLVKKEVQVIREALTVQVGTPEDPESKDTMDIYPRKVSVKRLYEGPARFFPISVKYQHSNSTGQGPCCRHLRSPESLPTTTRVRVVAKLSKEHDLHLEREGKAYQKLPSHMFQHWSGYNIIKPVYSPVPIGPIVPQFYGYYVPESSESKDQYLSPLLLLENCGVPINMESLSPDDSDECVSLFLRFHAAGWTHGSVAARNIVFQNGALSDSPRLKDPEEKSFRLIDLGRAMLENDHPESTGQAVLFQEKMEITRLFNKTSQTISHTGSSLGTSTPCVEAKSQPVDPKAPTPPQKKKSDQDLLHIIEKNFAEADRLRLEAHENFNRYYQAEYNTPPPASRPYDGRPDNEYVAHFEAILGVHCESTLAPHIEVK
ncbi:hypothetical protein C8J56DRAFT_1055338 [Mycena floridula]|nr:hypothetical protein C8J56DRAFT_1055338 [Mycena floridula]